MNGVAEAALFAALLAGLLFVMLLSVNSGAVRLRTDWIVGIVINKLSGRDVFSPRWPESAERIVWQLRIPRALAAALAGASLALSGVLMQALTKNALADPFILGVSSGASTGAVAALLLGALPVAGRFSAPAGAFGGRCWQAPSFSRWPARGAGRTSRDSC